MLCFVFASSPLLGGRLKALLYFRDQNYTLLLTTKHYFCFFYCCLKKTFMAPPRKPHQTTPQEEAPLNPPSPLSVPPYGGRQRATLGGLPDTPRESPTKPPPRGSPTKPPPSGRLTDTPLYSLRTFAPLRALRLRERQGRRPFAVAYSNTMQAGKACAAW